MKRSLFLVLSLALAGLVLSSCGGNETKGTTSIVASAVRVDAKSATNSFTFTVQDGSASSVVATSETEWIYNVAVSGNTVTFNTETNYGDTRIGTISLSASGAEPVKVSVSQSFYDFAEMTLTVSDISSYGCTARITPKSYKGNYFFIITNKSTVDSFLSLETHDYGDEDFLDALYLDDLAWVKEQAATYGYELSEYLTKNGALYKATATGEETEMPYSDLSYNSDYYLVAYGLSLTGERTTPVMLKAFSTSDIDRVDLTFKTSFTDVTASSANITVTPSSNEHTFYWTYLTEIEYAEEGNDPYTVMSDIVSSLKAGYGDDVSAVLNKGVSQEAVSSLWSNTKYTIVAWGMDSKGSNTTDPVEAGSFTTSALDVTDKCTFEVSVTEVQDMDMKIKVVPSDASTKYYVAAVRKSLTEGYNDEQFVRRIINMESTRFDQDYYGTGENWTNTTSLHSGTQELWGRANLYWTFVPNMDYVIYVFGVSADGVRTTAIAKVEQKTAAAKASSMTFTANVDDLNWHTMTYTVTPSTNDEYYLPFVIETSEIDDNGYRGSDGKLLDEALMGAILDYYSDSDDNAMYYTAKGKYTFKYTFYKSGIQYSLLLCGFNGSNTTSFYEIKVTPPAMPFGKSTATANATIELFKGSDLYALDADRWANYQEDCVALMKANPSENAAHWYMAFWQPYSHFESNGGLDYIVRLMTTNDIGNNIRDKKQGTSTPFWGGPNNSSVTDSWTDEDGKVHAHTPWCFYSFAEDADGNFSTMSRYYFRPVKTEADKVESYDVTCAKAYDFWTGASTSNVQAFAMSKDGSVKPVKF